jgi:hypothetical protein
MKLFKVLFFYIFLISSFIALAEDGQLAQQLTSLQKQLDALNEALQKIATAAEVPTPPVTPVEQPKPEPPVGLSPELIRQLKRISPEQLQKILDDLIKQHGGQLPPEPGGPPGPPPPPPEEGGPPSPPPPPPGPPPPPSGPGEVPPVVLKPKGLTEIQLDELTTSSRQASDQYLIKLLQRIGVNQFTTVDQLQSGLNKTLKLLGQKGAESQGFKFAEGNDPGELVNRIDKFISDRLRPKGGETLDAFLARVLNTIQNGTIQHELLSIFDDWVLGDKEAFNQVVTDNIEAIIINFGAAVRSAQEPQGSKVAESSPQANNSDKQFLDAFLLGSSKEDTIKRINRLRIDPVYLKYMSLQEDVKKGRARQVEAPEEPTTSKEAAQAAMMEEIRARKERARLTPEEIEARLKEMRSGRPPVSPGKAKAEVKPLTNEGIISILQLPKGRIKPSQVTDDYLRRYMFDPAKFQSVREENILIKYLGGVVIGRIERKPIVNYFKQVVDRAKNYNDIIEFMQALSSIEISENIRLSWKQTTKKTNETFDSATLRALKTQLKGFAAHQFTERIAQLIDQKINSVNLAVPTDLIDKLRGLQVKVKSALLAEKPEQTKKEINGYLQRNLPEFYTPKLADLQVDEELFALVKAIQEATLERK